MNLIVLVGKVKEPMVVKDTASGIQMGQILLDVERGYTKENSKAESDTYSITLWRSLIDANKDIIEEGQTIAVRGRLVANNFSKDDGEILYRTDLVAEKITYLS